MKSNRHLWLIELVWIVISMVTAGLVLFPIYIYDVSYTFTQMNVLFVFGFISFSRWLFLWRFTPYAWNQVFKLVLIFLMIPVIFTGIDQFYKFRTYLDEVGLQDMLAGLNQIESDKLSLYIRNEMIFFGTAFVITAILVPFKLVWNIWKQHNLNVV